MVTVTINIPKRKKFFKAMRKRNKHLVREILEAHMKREMDNLISFGRGHTVADYFTGMLDTGE